MRSSVWAAAIGLSAVLLVVLATTAAHVQTLFSNDPGDYVMKEANDAYNSGVRDAVRKRAAGDLKGALLSFSGAAGNGKIDEIPNYYVWIDMADLYCRLGDKKSGAALLKEYDCAVEVMAGHKMCWQSQNDPFFLVPNQKLSPLCYAAVCDTAFDTLYGQSSPELRARYRKHRALISQVRSECGR